MNLDFDDILRGGRFPTYGPKNRYDAILFLEKEGFLQLLERVKLAERYDIALMSTKGLSTTAGRLLVDYVCGQHGIPLLMLHDFDVAGFLIGGMFSRDTRRYSFVHNIRTMDLGLRLEDVIAYDLEAEDVHLKSDPTETLFANGATWDEIEFLSNGKRVELNAFTSDKFVEWIESKLVKLGIRKVVPELPVIEQAYRRELANQILREQLPDIISAANERANSADLPGDLMQRVRDYLKVYPAQPWDSALSAIVKQGA